jgi:hypothetical protein
MYASSLGLYPFAEELSTTLTPYCPVDKSLWAPTSTQYVAVLDAVNTPAPNPAMPITELRAGSGNLNRWVKWIFRATAA